MLRTVFSGSPPRAPHSTLQFSMLQLNYTVLEMYKVYKESATAVHSSFLYFRTVKRQGQLDSSWTVEQLFWNNMPLFHYDTMNKNRRCEDNAKKSYNWLVFRMGKLLKPRTLSSAPYGALLSETIPEEDLINGRSKHKVKRMRFSLLAPLDKSETVPP